MGSIEMQTGKLKIYMKRYNFIISNNVILSSVINSF